VEKRLEGNTLSRETFYCTATRDHSTQASTLEEVNKLEPTTHGQESRSIPSTPHGGEASTPGHAEFYKLYDPIRNRFTSMHGKFRTLEDAIDRRKHYIERTARGIRLDTIDWIRDTIIVKIKGGDIVESYCGDCGSIVDRETAKAVCSTCIRVIDPELLRS